MGILKKDGYMPVNEAVIIPTGNEIREGIVLDTNSPAVMYSLVCMEPLCLVHRETPVNDDKIAICQAIERWIEKNVGLIVLIGGSGGGHRFSSTLSEDYTHTALEEFLDEKAVQEIWGKNGHLWCKLLCGKKNGTVIVNIPGPFVEAKAAIEAFCRTYQESPSNFTRINAAMASAVLAQYPENAAVS